MTEWKRLSFCLTPREYEALRVHAAINGKPMSAFIRALLLETVLGDVKVPTSELPK